LSALGNAPARAAWSGVGAFDWRLLAIHSEWLFAAFATAVIVYRHWLNLKWVGGLWRDEAHAAELAQLASWREIIANLQWDSFPILSTALLRAWCYLPGGPSDEGLRWFGLLIGVGILAGLWWMAYRAHGGPPCVALLFWGLNPIAVRFGDSVRPHGLGLFWLVLVWSAVSNLVPAVVSRRGASSDSEDANALTPVRWTTWLLAGALAIAAVQTLFPNAVMLGAILAAAAVAAICARRWGRALGLILVGAVAAASLLPYIPAIRTASEWGVVSDAKSGGFANDFRLMYETLKFPGTFFSIAWSVLPVVLVAATVVAWFSGALAAKARRYRLLFALLAGLLGSGAYFALMARSSFLPQPWHWLPVLLLGALAAEQILGGWRAVPVARSGLLVLAVFTSAPLNQWMLGRYVTNIDLAAAHLTAEARPGDLILIERWYWGVSFHRYYHGPTPWVTIPPMQVINLHRYDLLQSQLQANDATAPIRESIATTLRAGGRVWMVGNLPRLTGDEPEFTKVRRGDLNTSAQLTLWAFEVGYFLQQHEQRRRAVSLPNERPVGVEEVNLAVAEGWRP
jgi:hypothetical protein